MRAVLLVLATLTLAAQDERAFLESMARLERQDPAGKKDLEDGSPLRAGALAMDPAKANEKDRYAAATWLWATNLIRGFHHGKDQTYLQAARGQADLLKAWSLLEGVGGELARSRDGLRLELAWRLLDLGRMRTAYAAVSGRSDLNVRELVHCFFVSAHLGDLAAMKKHAQALTAQGGKLEGLHGAAEATLTMFDYESLLKAVDAGRPGPAAGPLAVRSHRVFRQRVKIQRISGGDKALLKESESWPRDWVAKPDATTGLLQVGAAAHWVEGSAQPPVSGFLDATRLYLVGYREVQGEGGDSGRQDQVWDLHPDPGTPGRWRGTNTLTVWRAGGNPKAGPALQVQFEVEWDMRATETYPETP
ncbi:hypothetical protein [Geothrix edaphica]|uniref:Uncharacterized protein n=1 Tax=Geothrix edaphica TaxID=2927976 RepID=A0ABQ5PYS8_9BACT|nr:hypothetical protein [Geothrix edaphica]GLH67615.1 hypothetical protein GETHED_19790 [Geothrix edaphica]